MNVPLYDVDPGSPQELKCLPYEVWFKFCRSVFFGMYSARSLPLFAHCQVEELQV